MQAKDTYMELRVRLRYKSTSDFGKGDHLIYDKSLAHALEWLYDEDQFEDERTWLYCMEGVLPIYIMMSIVTDILTFALQEYAAININDYILRMEEGNYKHGWNDNKPSLLYLGDEIVLGRVHMRTSEVILWAAYLYASFRVDIDEDNKKLKKAKDVIYKLYWKKTGLKEEYVKDTFLMKHFDQTIRTLAMDAIHRYRDGKPVADKKPQQTSVNNKMEESALDKISPVGQHNSVKTPQPFFEKCPTGTQTQTTQHDDDSEFNQDADDGKWDRQYDYIFDPRVKPEALFNAMKKIKYHNKITDRRFYYVAYRVFDAINYFSKGISEHQYLQWINLHFNDKENRWIDDHDHIHLFRFKLEGLARNLKEHPSKWNTIKMYSDLASIYYKLANDLNLMST